MSDYEVELRAFCGPWKLRIVKIDDSKIDFNDNDEILAAVFFWGQNDFQDLPLPSVSVGDVIRLHDGRRFRVEPVGFREMPHIACVRCHKLVSDDEAVCTSSGHNVCVGCS